MSVTITTTANSIIVEKGNNHFEVAKSGLVHRRTPSGSDLVSASTSVSIDYREATADGQTFTSAEQLHDWISANAFKSGGTGPGPEPGTLKSQQEEGKGLAVTNYLPITQEDFDDLAVKKPTTTYDIIAQYPTT